MDAAFQLKNAAVAADKLAVGGSRFCNWSMPIIDSSDLENAISRFLLNNGTRVPENIPGSKMWHVSLVAADLVHQLSLDTTECYLKIRYSDDARSVGQAAFSRLTKLVAARSTFGELAYRQTKWQEQDAALSRPQVAAKVDPASVRTAAHEVKESAEAARQLMAELNRTPGCLHHDPPLEPPELTNLTALIDYLEHTPHLPKYIPAANMWGVTGEAEAMQLGIVDTMRLCSPNADDKKKARILATNSLGAYHRLSKAIATFEVLALQQVE